MKKWLTLAVATLVLGCTEKVTQWTPELDLDAPNAQLADAPAASPDRSAEIAALQEQIALLLAQQPGNQPGDAASMEEIEKLLGELAKLLQPGQTASGETLAAPPPVIDGGPDSKWVPLECENHAECKEFHKTKYAYCIDGTCVNKAAEWACYNDKDCSSGQYCNQKFNLCEAKKPAAQLAPIQQAYDAIISPEQMFIDKLDSALEIVSGQVGGSGGSPYRKECQENEYPVGLKVWYDSDYIAGLQLICKNVFTSVLRYGDIVGIADAAKSHSEQICADGTEGIGVWVGVKLFVYQLGGKEAVVSLQIYCGFADHETAIIEFDGEKPESYKDCLGFYKSAETTAADYTPGLCKMVHSPAMPRAAGGSGETIIVPTYKKHAFVPGVNGGVITGITGSADQYPYNIHAFGILSKSLGGK